MLTVMAGTAAVLIALGVILLSLFAGDKNTTVNKERKLKLLFRQFGSMRKRYWKI